MFLPGSFGAISVTMAIVLRMRKLAAERGLPKRPDIVVTVIEPPAKAGGLIRNEMNVDELVTEAEMLRYLIREVKSLTTVQAQQTKLDAAIEIEAKLAET